MGFNKLVSIPPPPRVLFGEERSLKDQINSDNRSVPPETYDAFVTSKGRGVFAKQCIELIRELSLQYLVHDILEVGVGTGIMTQELNKIPEISVTGIDINPEYINFGIQHNRIRSDQIHIGDFHSLPIPDNSIDLYTGVAILAQREDPHRFYSEAKRVVRNEGLIFLPWAYPKIGSIDREIALFSTAGIELLEQSNWFVLGQIKK